VGTPLGDQLRDYLPYDLGVYLVRHTRTDGDLIGDNCADSVSKITNIGS
jgi:hypothetical protein